ncbi:MAG TPA: DnaD domain protein [Nitrolancea sp.]|nr:DnaD domain protein [Nitrolancea sp.]
MVATRSDRDLPIPIPRSFFDRHLPRIRDVAALKVLLTIYRIVAGLGADEQYVAEDAITNDRVLLDGLRLIASSRNPLDEIHRAIDLLVAHDAIVRICLEEGDDESFWLMPKEPGNQIALNTIVRGERPFPFRRATGGKPSHIAIERPNVFRLYEQNIGMLTPLLADQLIEAIELYPDSWIEEAINEAVSLNRRSWRYIQRILQRWETEGRGDETDRRNRSAAGFVQPEKYLHGKYSSLFRRRD